MKLTKDDCQKEALKYNTKIEFFKNSNSIYRKSYKKGWLDDICRHMKIRKEWTYEECKKVCLMFNSIKDIEINYPSAYNSIIRNKWKNDLFSHIKIKNNWTKEKCIEKAKCFRTQKEFRKKYSGAYDACFRNGWLDDINKFFNLKIKWTKEKCLEKAKLCNTKSEFQKKYKSAYIKSLKNNWLDEFCSHMEIVGNRNKRCIYVWLFEDNFVYVGLTYNLKKRKNQHMTDIESCVYKHLQICSGFTYTQLTKYVDKEEATKLEKFYVEKYKNDGFIILNKAKTGGLGGNCIKWTYENVLKESKKYKNKSDFKNNSIGAYNAARNNGYLSEIFYKK